MATRWLPGVIRLLATTLIAMVQLTLTSTGARSQQLVTVNTTAATVDGDTSSVAALSANAGADGKISFAEAVKAVDNTGPGYTIKFALPHGSVIITGTTALVISAPNTTIEGDEDGDGKPDVAIYAVTLGSFWVPISVQTGHVNILHLSIAGLSLYGDSAHDCRIDGCYCGPNVDGTTALPTYGDGLELRHGAHNNTVVNCIISGNVASPGNSGATGLLLWDGAHDNTVQSCRVGVDINGAALPNEIGLSVGTNTSPAPNNIIGGIRSATTNPGNVVSGNNSNGLEVIGPGTTGNTVSGNIVGLDPSGTKAVPNGGPSKFTAFFVGRGAANNTIGGIRASATEGGGNIISGNGGVGLRIRYAGSTGNVVMGNMIGTDLTGAVVLPNGDAGVQIQDGATGNTIGTVNPSSTYPNFGNVIVGNLGPGVRVMDVTALGNRIRGNEIHDNAAIGIDLVGNDRAAGDHVTPNDETDSDTGPNGLMNFPVGVTAWYDANKDATIISGILQTASPDTATVDLYVDKKVDASGFGGGERWVGSVTPTASGTFRFSYAGKLPADLPFLSATATDADGNTSEFGPAYGDPDGDGNPDSDGDGLPDEWETKGIDFDGDGVADLDLKGMGANPMHKDIFVEIDYMEAADHTHNPTLHPDKTLLSIDPLANVQAAFILAPVHNPDGSDGIDLHTTVDESIPEVTPIFFGVHGPGATDDFDDLKLGNPRSIANGHFGTAADRASPDAWKIIGARRLAFRYCIFGHNYSAVGSSGIAELGGNDFMVTLRSHEPGPNNDYEDTAHTLAAAWGTTFDDEWVDLVAGTFMHELGHTLGLDHGGGQGIPDASAANRAINGKPNYLSVMRYGRQWDEAGKATSLPGIAEGTTVRQGRPLDYSRSALPALDENHLNELDGIAGVAGERTLYGSGGNRHIGPSTGGVDWNASGAATGVDVSGDINYISDKPSLPASPGETLLGHDDWANLIYDFRASTQFADGDYTPGEQTEETDRDYLVGCLGGLPAQNALAIAGGLQQLFQTDLSALNTVNSGSSAARVDLLDAVRLARKAAGLDP